jgi:hypothetical protein
MDCWLTNLIDSHDQPDGMRVFSNSESASYLQLYNIQLYSCILNSARERASVRVACMVVALLLLLKSIIECQKIFLIILAVNNKRAFF